MNEEEQLKIAEQIARESHKGQKRPIGSEDYIIHPEAVVKLVGDNIKLKIVAWLHDVIEDTDVSLRDLQDKGISQELLDSINHISRRTFEPYNEYISNIKDNWIAREVKIADLKHNLSDLKKGNMRDKYELALACLQENKIKKEEK